MKNCQEYIRTLSAELPTTSLPVDASVVIIGCGAPSLIPSYVELTSCPYPIYADPSTQLYTLLGMTRSLSLGRKDPAYIQHTLAAGIAKSIVQGLRRVKTGDVMRAGNMSVNGGEFLLQVTGRGRMASRPKDNNDLELSVTFCHRMANTRDHAEVQELRRALHLSDDAELRRQRPQRRWTTMNLTRSLSNRVSRSSSSSRTRRKSPGGSRDSRRPSPDHRMSAVLEEPRSRNGAEKPIDHVIIAGKDSAIDMGSTKS